MEKKIQTQFHKEKKSKSKEYSFQNMGKPANKDLDFTLRCDSIDEAVLLMVLQISVRQSCCMWSQHTSEPLENGKIQ